MAPPFPLIFLLMIHGVSSADWGVSYKPLHICALNNSSVIMNCTYTYPTGHQIMKVFWSKDTVRGKEPPDLSEDPEYSQRLQYLGDKQQNCTIRLSHVTMKDSHEYYFRFITDKPDGKWIGTPGVTLNVADLQVESPERVTEGDSVRLTCKSSCTLTDRATFIWYRNSQPLTERRDRNNELLLQSVRREDAGRYSCAVHGHNHISPAVELSVMYPPSNISVSISPSGEIVSGDSVTLSCSSDSNPPAEISWFKGGTFVRAGRIYSISKISSDDSGEYKCKSINEHGEKYSDAVTLNVMYPPRNVSVLITGSGETASGDSVTLNCSSDSNPPAEISWFKGGTFVGSGRIYNISKISSDDSGEYKCKSINKHGEKYSDAVTLNVMYPPRNVSVLITGSGEVVSGDSVTLICSSDSNPPALNLSWFKRGTFVGSGRIYNISKISSDDSGQYKCKSINKHGEKYSDSVTLNVMYPPRNVSVLITGSGERVSGDSVTLSCSSDSNPPAEISWLKGGTFVGNGRIHNISKISSDDSGQYKCKSINKHGEKYSDAVTLNVMYPPRNVTVLIKRSGEIVSGDSVTLICSSDSNPPALNFSWFKENESSAVGSGQSFSALQSGRFYCQAHNQHGSQRSDAVTVTGEAFINTLLYLHILHQFGEIMMVFLFQFFMNDLHSVASQRVSVHDEPLSEPDSANDAPYDSVKPNRFGGKTPESRDTEEVQYTTVQHLRKEEKKRLEETECQNDDIRVHQPDAAVGEKKHLNQHHLYLHQFNQQRSYNLHRLHNLSCNIIYFCSVFLDDQLLKM
ncbi:B-cell receptor CD22 [Anabarilius grahami]|uniref:B-cell receptor CD22 n=1 Tax=Anabarilius grahami TaxID=495550 RepID=A0A3N0Y9J3_ANAGA|nr:B-cell receptor CD22 [Anabarilius grahami]